MSERLSHSQGERYKPNGIVTYPIMRGCAPLGVAMASAAVIGEAPSAAAWLGIVGITLGVADGMALEDDPTACSRTPINRAPSLLGTVAYRFLLLPVCEAINGSELMPKPGRRRFEVACIVLIPTRQQWQYLVRIVVSSNAPSGCPIRPAMAGPQPSRVARTS